MKFLKNVFRVFILVFVYPTIVFSNEFEIDPRVIYGKLDNGLTYYIRKNDKPSDKVILNLTIKAGSLMENEKQLGLAHLLEHMAFNGSKNFPKRDVDSYLNSIGLSIGADFNAFTGRENTVYEFQIPINKKGAIEKGVFILSDIASNLSLEPEAFERERKIVEEEWREDAGFEDKYYDQVLSSLLNNSLHFKRKPIGEIEIIRNFEYDDAIAYYKKWYQPNAMAIFAVGNVDPKIIENLIKKYFSDKKNTSNNIYPSYRVPDFSENKFVLFQDKKETELNFSIYEKKDNYKINTFQNYRTSILEILMYSMFENRLNELIYINNPSIVSASLSEAEVTLESSYKYLTISLKEDVIQKGIEEVYELFESTKRFGFEQQELDLALKNYLTNLSQDVNEIDTRDAQSFIDEYTRHFTFDEMISGRKKEYELAQKISSNLEVEEINSLFQNFFTNQNRIILITAPERIKNLPSENEVKNYISKVEQSNVEKFVVKKIQDNLIDFDLKEAEVTKETYNELLDLTYLELSNGAKIYLKQTDFDSNKIYLKARSYGGYSHVESEKLSSARYFNKITSLSDIYKFSVPELERIIPLEFASITPFVSRYTEGINGRTITKYTKKWFELLYLTFTDVRFNEELINNFKIENLQIYNNTKNQNSTKFQIKLTDEIYNNHPRKKSLTDKDISKINIQDIKNIYKERFSDASDFYFIIVGDFKYKEILPYIKKYIGSLPSTFNNEYYVDRNIRSNKGKGVVIQADENPIKTTEYRFYNREFSNKTKDRVTYNLLIDILDKMLFDSIREEQNLVYSIGAGSYFNRSYPENNLSMMIFYSGEPSNVKKINLGIDKILNQITHGHFDKKTFEEKKMGMLDEYNGAILTNSFWLESIDKFLLNKEPLERIEYIDDIIKSINVNDVTRLAKKIFKNDKYIQASLLEKD